MRNDEFKENLILIITHVPRSIGFFARLYDRDETEWHGRTGRRNSDRWLELRHQRGCRRHWNLTRGALRNRAARRGASSPTTARHRGYARHGPSGQDKAIVREPSSKTKFSGRGQQSSRGKNSTRARPQMRTPPARTFRPDNMPGPNRVPPAWPITPNAWHSRRAPMLSTTRAARRRTAGTVINIQAKADPATKARARHVILRNSRASSHGGTS